MMATTSFRPVATTVRLLLLPLVASVCFSAHAESAPARYNVVRFTALAERTLAAARKTFDSDRTNAAAVTGFARACFDRAEFAANDADRAILAVQGIDACRKLLARETNSAAAHYYLGMNLGQLARTKTLGALNIVDEMEREFKAAARLDPKFDFAGPHRNLGQLYFEAPGWPTSIGSRTKAKHHLQQAVELAGDYPENRLNLLEAWDHWGERNSALRELNSLNALWPAAKTNLTGEAWESSWADWEKRRTAAQKKLDEKKGR